MVSIVGSIDNAGIWNTQYHLIFTENEIFQCLVMTGKERVSDIYKAGMSNPKRMVPVAGQASNYSVTKQEIQMIVDENIRRGKNLETNLEEKIRENPSAFQRIPYENINGAELANGSPLSLPHLLLKVGHKSLKFHLLHNNYQGRGKLDENTFNAYRETLSKALGEKLVIKE